MATTEAPTASTHLRATGFNDYITTCDLCGRQELKGTVRLAIIRDGEEVGVRFAGVACAAKVNGTTVADIRREAQDAEDTRREAARAHERARSAASRAIVDTILTAQGIDPATARFATLRDARNTTEHQDAMAAWDATHQAA